MRPIHLAQLDERRPVLVLTREIVVPHIDRITVAPITTAIRGLSTELPLGPANGLDEPCVANCDSIVTVAAAAIGPRIGYLLRSQEPDLATAIDLAFDLSRPR